MAIESVTRRRFLGTAGRAGLLALGAPALALNGADNAEGATSARSYAEGSYGLVLDNSFAGFLTGFAGGNVVADVIKAPPGPDRVQRKRLGAPRVEPVTIECGLPMAKTLHDWIKSSIGPGPRPMAKSGAIVEFDRTFKELGRRSFSGALITEVEFPSCDASSKDAAALTLTFAPQSMALSAAGATPLPKPAPRSLRSNFRLSIQGLEQALSRTTAIDAIDVKLTPAIEVANLSVAVSDAFIGQIYAWHQEFVVKGSNKPRAGVLEYLSPDLKTALLTLQFTNLGIIKVGPETLAAGATAPLRRSKVEMYCEAVTVV